MSMRRKFEHYFFFFFSSRRRHTRLQGDWSSDVCSSDLAVPNLRGGGEYGEEWHQGGMHEKKQNVFDDFIAAAEYLIAQRYTSPAKLAIAGGANGGPLLGAALTQRPGPFRAALPPPGGLGKLRVPQITVRW